MAVNADKPLTWKKDIALSVDCYNKWFLKFAPDAYRKTRVQTTEQVERALQLTSNLTRIEPSVLREFPEVLPILRMSTAPPLARDRLIGLAQVSSNLVRSMELYRRLPPLMSDDSANLNLSKIGAVISKLADPDIFPWLSNDSHGARQPSSQETYRASTIVADRLCGAVADPIIRNAQEQRQLAAIEKWLVERGYRLVPSSATKFGRMEPGTFAFRLNVPVILGNSVRINIPVDAVVMPKQGLDSELPLLIEAKSAGDFTNTNKRRKEEATKVSQLRATHGDQVKFILFLCGYFDSPYLGYEAAEGIDWVWEHRIDDLVEFGL